MIAFYNSDANCGVTVIIRMRSSTNDFTTGAKPLPQPFYEQECILWCGNDDRWMTDAERAQFERDLDEFKKACRKLKLLPKRKPPKPEEHSRRRRMARPLLRAPAAKRTCSGMARVLVPRGC